MVKITSYKILKYGHVYEVMEYTGSFSARRLDDWNSCKGGRDKEGKEGRKMEYRQSVSHKAREKVRRLITANFNENDLFITLTFKENMTDVKQANYELKKFLQKMKRKQSDFLHVTVLEFQKRGAVHYHMVCNYRLRWESTEQLKEHERELAKTWTHGFVDIVDIKHVDNVGAYLVKYMSKQNYDDRLEGNKRYFFLVTANNLNRYLTNSLKRL